MQIRASRISASIARAISRQTINKRSSGDILRSILAFFAFFKLLLTRYRPADFVKLRCEVWEVNDEEYVESFDQSADAGTRRGKEKSSELVPVGDLGYSGSTFFMTANSKYLIKSLPRRFEHEFFTHDLFDPYVAHMMAYPTSLLVRITDMAYTPRATLGGILGFAPTHHIVMENLLFGKEMEEEEAMKEKWETYDLKPSSYFFPERDIAGGMLAPQSVKDRLIDEFPGKIAVSKDLKRELLDALDRDTGLLADHLAVDYSLFLVRYPSQTERSTPSPVKNIKSHTSAWRAGADDAEGKWTYRAVVLDFFWAKHKFNAKMMTGLVKTFNLIARKGPMSITAEPQEYRSRFMKMVDELVVAQEG